MVDDTNAVVHLVLLAALVLAGLLLVSVVWELGLGCLLLGHNPDDDPFLVSPRYCRRCARPVDG